MWQVSYPVFPVETIINNNRLFSSITDYDVIGVNSRHYLEYSFLLENEEVIVLNTNSSRQV